MNKGVQILLERIKSNPEEFAPDIAGRYPEKWRVVSQQVQARASGEKQFLDFLSDAEIAELWQAMQNVRGDEFTKQIMNTLLRDGELSLSFAQEPSETKKSSYAISASQAKWLSTLDPYEKKRAMELLKEYAEGKI
jgi:protein-disulfide isomerase-like protein with CxxC motif